MQLITIHEALTDEKCLEERTLFLANDWRNMQKGLAHNYRLNCQLLEWVESKRTLSPVPSLLWPAESRALSRMTPYLLVVSQAAVEMAGGRVWMNSRRATPRPFPWAGTVVKGRAPVDDDPHPTAGPYRNVGCHGQMLNKCNFKTR